MRLPARMLTTTATVLSQVKGAEDRLGQATTTTWAATGQPVPAAHFPAGERITTQAQLKGVKVAREAYLQGSIDLNPQTHRLRLDGQDYAITLVNEWPGFTVAGLVGV